MAGLNHYDVLGVGQDAAPEEIKKAYRKLASKTHPDTAGPAMKPLFLAVQEAWENLGTVDRRTDYDRVLGGGRSQPQEEPAQESGGPDQPQEYHDYHPGGSAPTSDTGDHPAARKPLREVTETTPAPLLLLITVAMAVAWLVIGAVLIAQGLLEEPTVGDPFAGAGVGVYMLGAVVCAVLSLVSVRRRRGQSKAQLVAVGLGALVTYSSYQEQWVLMAILVALGLVTSVLFSALYRRRLALARLGFSGRDTTVTEFVADDLEPRTIRARSMTRTLLGDLSKQPGTRVLGNAPLGGGSLGHIIVNGGRVAIIDSVLVDSWPDRPLTRDLRKDFQSVQSQILTTIYEDAALLRRFAPELRGWLVVHPMSVGSVGLTPSAGVEFTAAAGSEAVEEILGWLSEGDRFGRVNVGLVHRLISHGRSALY